MAARGPALPFQHRRRMKDLNSCRSSSSAAVDRTVKGINRPDSVPHLTVPKTLRPAWTQSCGQSLEMPNTHSDSIVRIGVFKYCLKDQHTQSSMVHDHSRCQSLTTDSRIF